MVYYLLYSPFSEFANNWGQLTDIMSCDGKYMLLKMTFAPMDENGMYPMGYATVKSPNAYQSSQRIFEVITIHGPGVPSFTEDVIHVDALPMCQLDPTGACFAWPTRTFGPGLGMTVSAFEDAFNERMNRELNRRREQVLAPYDDTVPPLLEEDGSVHTPPPKSDMPLEVPMTMSRAPSLAPQLHIVAVKSPLPALVTEATVTVVRNGLSPRQNALLSTAAGHVAAATARSALLKTEPLQGDEIIELNDVDSDNVELVDRGSLKPPSSNSKATPKRTKAEQGEFIVHVDEAFAAAVDRIPTPPSTTKKRLQTKQRGTTTQSSDDDDDLFIEKVVTNTKATPPSTGKRRKAKQVVLSDEEDVL